MKTLKVLFVGLGSIGKRHLKNLHAVAAERGAQVQAWALRSSQKPLPDDVCAQLAGQLYAWDEAAYDYDAAFVTNPTSLHFDALQKLRGRARALFIEKPLFSDPSQRLADCIDEAQTAYVAAPMRWCGAMLALKAALGGLRPYSARVICSSYLPDWRPGVDYRTVYSARRALGGGVTIDLIHEWDYLVDLFGMPLETHNLRGTYSELEIDSDDLSVYIARWPHMLGEVHLDYFGRTYRRSIELFCKDGTVTADFGAGTLTLADGTVQNYAEPVNERYVREMRHFLDVLDGRCASANTPQTALNVLKLTLGESV